MQEEIFIHELQATDLDASLYSRVVLTDDGGDKSDNGRSIIELWSAAEFAGLTLTIRISDTRDPFEIARAKSMVQTKFGKQLEKGDF